MDGVSRFDGWRQVGISCLVQNLGFGLVYGGFGSILGALERQIGMSRFQSSSGMSVIFFALALTMTVAGPYLTNRNLRWVMVGGMVIEALAFLGLATAKHYYVYLLACATMGVNIGATVMICTLLLISRWFNAKRGMALGLVYIPLAMPLAPLLASSILPLIGLKMLMTIYAGVCLAAATIVALFTTERPGDIGQVPFGGMLAVDERASQASGGGYSFFNNWRFWTLALGLAVLNAASSVFMSHIVVFARETGLSLQQASIFPFAFGVAGIAGVPLGGWLADRIGGVTLVAVMCALAAMFWEVASVQPGMTILLALAACYGSLLTGLAACQGVAYGELFWPDQIGRVAGVIFVVQLPVLVIAPPLVGQLRVATGSYILPFRLMATTCLITLVIVAFTAFLPGRRAVEMT